MVEEVSCLIILVLRNDIILVLKIDIIVGTFIKSKWLFCDIRLWIYISLMFTEKSRKVSTTYDTFSTGGS